MKTVEFVARGEFPVPAVELFDWHTRPGAFERLTPPWERVEVLSRQGSVRDGDQTILRVRLGPIAKRWVALHSNFQPGREFTDEQLAGPFASWRHTHRVAPGQGGASTLEDRIEYALPLGALGRAVGGRSARRRVERMFRYRHQVLKIDLERHRMAGERRWRIAISGASGLLGSALTAFLTSGGHAVEKLVRERGRGGVFWNPAAGELDAAALEGVDAVVHLAGENIAGGRWNAARKERVSKSRTDGTRLIAETLARLKSPPKVLVSASAIGFYGAHGDEPLDEGAPAGEDFLASVCRDWEAAAEPARAAGIRVVHPRFGVVLTPGGGALQRMLTPFRLGLGGRVGGGRQVMSWVALDDAIGAIHFALFNDAVAGAINVTAPHPAPNAEFVATLGRVLRRPTFLPLPAFMVRTLFGEMGDALLLSGARVLPAKLQSAGFEFTQPELEPALRYMLGAEKRAD